MTTELWRNFCVNNFLVYHKGFKLYSCFFNEFIIECYLNFSEMEALFYGMWWYKIRLNHFWKLICGLNVNCIFVMYTAFSKLDLLIPTWSPTVSSFFYFVREANGQALVVETLISQGSFKSVSTMWQNNSTNDSKQENQHQSSSILLEVNSDNEIGREENGKAGENYELKTCLETVRIADRHKYIWLIIHVNLVGK